MKIRMFPSLTQFCIQVPRVLECYPIPFGDNIKSAPLECAS